MTKGTPNSPILKRSIVLDGHKTSVSLEDAFWNEVKRIAAERSQSVAELIGAVDKNRKAGSNLSCALRLAVLANLQKRIGHGAGASMSQPAE